jgi:glycosyltransferase involved in cell wall biosynthesis
VQEPLVQTQVIPYLRELQKDGHEISLLTFESGDARAAIGEELREQGIDWHRLKYHKRPSAPATAYDLINGARYAIKLARRKKFDIFHVRGQIAGPIGALAKRATGGKLLLDIRGFIGEEYVDAGVWAGDGAIYRNFKRVENWLMRNADGFVVLTEAAREVLFPESKETGREKQGRPVEVIPCCVDFQNRFASSKNDGLEEVETKLGLNSRFVVVHVGALGGLYLTEQMVDFIAAARSKDSSTFALFLTQSDPKLVVPLLIERGFNTGDFYVGRVPASEIPHYLMASNLGMSFVKATYATLSRSPTKIPEYLACGIPLVANAGVGDVDRLIEEGRAGALIRQFNDDAYLKALDEVTELRNSSARLESLARTEFDLEMVGGERYRRLYGNMLSD